MSMKAYEIELTGAGSRAYGERLLHEEYDAFREGKRDTLIMIMDVDYFKQFNDGFGHEVHTYRRAG